MFSVGVSTSQDSLVDLDAMRVRAGKALEERLDFVARRTDGLLAILTALLGLGLILMTVPWFRSFADSQNFSRSDAPSLALWGGSVLALLAVGLSVIRAGRPVTRHIISVSLILMSALFGQSLGGHVDWHFLVFVAFALLTLYRDWRVLLSASVAAFLPPLLRGTPVADPWGWIEHFGGLAAENVLLAMYCRQRVREMGWLAERHLLLQATEELVGESSAKTQSSEQALMDVRRRLAQSHLEWEDGARLRAEELAQANAALQRSNSMFRAQQEATTDGILVVNENYEVESCNHRFCDLWQIPDVRDAMGNNEALRRHLRSLTKQPERFQELMDHCDRNPAEHARDEVELLDGRILERSTQSVFSEMGQYYGRVWYFRDITDRKRAEAQVIGLNHELSHANDAITRAYDATIEGWSRALDLRDKETEGHCQRVTELTLRLAVAMGLCGEDLIQIRRGALLHDIGKMGVPDQILLKPGPLTEDEWTVMHRHPVYAHEMLSPIAFLRPALDIPWCHHEKWDGTGYPRGLRGREIPLAARLFTIVDVWDALCSDRPYRAAWSEDRVRDHLCSLAGSHFDPELVPIFLSVVSPCDHISGDDLFSTRDLFPTSESPLELRWAA